MRYLIQFPHHPSEISGVLTYVRHLEKTLEQSNDQVTKVSTKSQGFRDWFQAMKGVDVIHQNSNHFVFALLGKLMGKRVILKYHFPIYHKVLSIYGEDWQKENPGFWNSFSKEVYLLLFRKRRPWRALVYDAVQVLRLSTIAACSLIVDERWACSNALRDHCQLPVSVKTVYNPFSPEPDENPQNPTRDTIVFAGRLSSKKGIEILVRAIAHLKDQADLPKVRILGDGGRMEFLTGLVKELGIEERVDFLGQVDSKTVKAEMQRAIAVVIPSLCFDPAPYVVWEAMNAGAVPIVANRGGLPELAGEDGIIVPTYDPKDFAKAIQQVLSTSKVS